MGGYDTLAWAMHPPDPGGWVKIPWPGQLAPPPMKTWQTQKLFKHFKHKFQMLRHKICRYNCFYRFLQEGVSAKIMWPEQFSPNHRKPCKQSSEN